jgi:hypothetical protein
MLDGCEMVIMSAVNVIFLIHVRITKQSCNRLTEQFALIPPNDWKATGKEKFQLINSISFWSEPEKEERKKATIATTRTVTATTTVVSVDVPNLPNSYNICT